MHHSDLPAIATGFIEVVPQGPGSCLYWDKLGAEVEKYLN